MAGGSTASGAPKPLSPPIRAMSSDHNDYFALEVANISKGLRCGTLKLNSLHSEIRVRRYVFFGGGFFVILHFMQHWSYADARCAMRGLDAMMLL